MIAEKLIETARALARKFPDQQQSIDSLIQAVERIDREFDGDQRMELLTQASKALERNLQRAQASAKSEKALRELHESYSSLDDAMERLSEAANGAAHLNMLRNLAAAWPRSPSAKKVIWN